MKSTMTNRFSYAETQIARAKEHWARNNSWSNAAARDAIVRALADLAPQTYGEIEDVFGSGEPTDYLIAEAERTLALLQRAADAFEGGA